jgi:hypothetical protein
MFGIPSPSRQIQFHHDDVESKAEIVLNEDDCSFSDLCDSVKSFESFELPDEKKTVEDKGSLSDVGNAFQRLPKITVDIQDIRKLLDHQKKLHQKKKFEESITSNYDNHLARELKNRGRSLEQLSPAQQADVADQKENYLSKLIAFSRKVVDEVDDPNKQIVRIAQFEKQLLPNIHRDNISKGKNQKACGRMAVNSEQLKQVYKRAQLMNSLGIQDAKKNIELAIKKSREINSLLEVSARLDIKPYEVTPEQLLDLELEESKNAFEELLKMEEKSEGGLKPQPKVRKGRAKKVEKRSSAVADKATPSRAVEAKPPSLSDLKTNYLLSIHQRKPWLKIAKRVRRWETNDLETIRTFRDKQGELQRYLNLSPEDICQQRMYHLHPGLFLVLSDENDRMAYAFDTGSGYRVIATITQKGKVTAGYIDIGVTDGVIIHSYFTESSYQNVNQLFNAPKHENEEDENHVQWESNVPYEFSILDKGVLSMNYSSKDLKESYSVEIYPVRKKYLNPSIRSAI